MVAVFNEMNQQGVAVDLLNQKLLETHGLRDEEEEEDMMVAQDGVSMDDDSFVMKVSGDGWLFWQTQDRDGRNMKHRRAGRQAGFTTYHHAV